MKRPEKRKAVPLSRQKGTTNKPILHGILIAYPIPRRTKGVNRSPDFASSYWNAFPSFDSGCAVGALFVRPLHGYWDSAGFAPASHGAFDRAACCHADTPANSFVVRIIRGWQGCVNGQKGWIVIRLRAALAESPARCSRFPHRTAYRSARPAAARARSPRWY